MTSPRRAAAAGQHERSTGGTIRALTPAGPILGGDRAVKKSIRQGTFQAMLDARGRLVIAALTIAWVGAVVSFWVWWLQPRHLVTWTGLLINSVLLVYLSYLPIYFIVSVNRLRRINPKLEIPLLRTAFVVTKAPSEPWHVARRTLEAMQAQEMPYAYDVWLCDEDPSQETLDWCERSGVSVSSRKGVAHYHNAEWPRRTKCKEGNLAYFYDHWGYRDYDIVAQLDCDHVPHRTYLREILRSFTDPAIGYVAAPNVCDANAATSWASRGRSHKEATQNGPVQAGHQDGLGPVCFGSHYAVRTQALQEIGGVGPELAEDFSTTFLMTSAGWEGGFAHDAEAHGDGPHTIPAMLTQEYQWSRSLVTVLYQMLPQHLHRFGWRLRLRWLFALSYYPTLSISMIVGLLLPPVAILTGIPWVNVNYFEFLGRWLLISLVLLTLAIYLKRRDFMRPRNVPILSWENWLYSLARWPYIAWGALAATIRKLYPRPISFKVTPKAPGGLERLPSRLLAPYLVISLVLSIAALGGQVASNAAGYVFLCLVGSVAYATVSMLLPLLHSREAARSAGVSWWVSARSTVMVPLLLAASLLVPLLPAVVLYPAYASQIFGW